MLPQAVKISCSFWKHPFPSVCTFQRLRNVTFYRSAKFCLPNAANFRSQDSWRVSVCNIWPKRINSSFCASVSNDCILTGPISNSPGNAGNVLKSYLQQSSAYTKVGTVKLTILVLLSAGKGKMSIQVLPINGFWTMNRARSYSHDLHLSEKVKQRIGISNERLTYGKTQPIFF